MATIHNPTNDDLAFPNAAGVEVPIPAGATVEVDAETAKALAGHPILKTGRAIAAKKAARARKRKQKAEHKAEESTDPAAELEAQQPSNDLDANINAEEL